MRTSRVLFLVVAVLAAAVVAGVANAHTGSFDTKLSIKRSPDGRVDTGTVVKFSGRLRSGKDACTNGSKIRLIEIGVGVVGRDRTNNNGRYKIKERVDETARFRTRYPGEVLNATHPHNHTCESSRSEKIEVRVG